MLLWFGIVAAVLLVTALTSRLVEKSPLSFPLMFMGLGFLLGRWGLLELHAHDLVLEVVATLTLALVLFLDAVRLERDGLRGRWSIPILVLGPGTAIILFLGAAALVALFGLPWLPALMGGAALASTDPVVLREIVRDERIPRSIRQVMKVEAGVNDLVVLPVLLILIALAGSRLESAAGWAEFLFRLLVLGPAIGFVVGGGGSWLMGWANSRLVVRNEYQALYGIGLVLASYTAATAAGGDGFLAAFAGGWAVVVLNQSLCDCFLDYGEITAEMAMMVAFVLFGAVIAGLTSVIPMGPALLLGLLVIFLIRPLVIALVLLRVRMSREARGLLAWFGPRGLNSLLLTLLVVHAGVEGAVPLLAVVGIVVLMSVFAHGASVTPVSAWYARRVAAETLDEERESSASALLGHGVRDEDEIERIGPEELGRRLAGPDPPLLLDVRSRSSFDPGNAIAGSERVPPDRVRQWASERPVSGRLLVPYCT